MLTIQKPDGLLSVSVHNVLNWRRDDEKLIKTIEDWTAKKPRKIILRIEPIVQHSLTITFDGTDVSFQRGEVEKPDLKVTMDAKGMIDMAFGRLGLVSAFLKGKMKIKGIYKVGSLLKFKKIFYDTLKIMAEEPNTNYFEVYEKTR